jgi:hypothetical protein
MGPKSARGYIKIYLDLEFTTLAKGRRLWVQFSNAICFYVEIMQSIKGC